MAHKNIEKSKIESYEFANFDTGEIVQKFEFKTLDGREKKFDAQILRKERFSAKNSQFKISPAVEQYRGLIDQEKADQEKRIEQEVQRRLNEIKQAAYQEAFEKGEDVGRTQAYEEAKIYYEEKLLTLEDQLLEVRKSKESMLEEYKNQIYKVTKNLIKWVVLKESNEDRYLPQLFEKLILELNEKNNLLVKINKDKVQEFEEVIKGVEAKLGELRNVRVEVFMDANTQGIIVESENGILDGTMEAQFESLDKLFSTLGIDS